jgi:threonine/homoserine/homoserine lactone efflux protein
MMTVTFGPYPTLARLLGLVAGLGMQVIAVGGALSVLLARWPQLYMALPWVGTGCALYLGWLWVRPGSVRSSCGGEPLAFGDVAALQFMNPRTWLISVTGATLLLPPALKQVLSGAFPGTI